MLAYLDNAVSTADSGRVTLADHQTARDSARKPVPAPRAVAGLNENFARELLELHTLGVDGGYTETDVTEVARAFTGWTYSTLLPRSNRPFTAPPARGTIGFAFDPAGHDAEAKVVLGTRLGAGRGAEDGQRVLDILAAHPSTARHIASKLAVRFVSDTPSAALVERAAATFLRTEGDIREVMRTIVTSPEFVSPAAYRAKVKTPHELVLSMRRALAAPPDTAAETIDLLIGLEQPPFGKRTPEGWPETAASWVSVGAMQARLDLANRVARGLPSIPIESSPVWRALVERPFDAQVEGVIAMLLGGQASAETRGALVALADPSHVGDPSDGRDRLRAMIAIALSSPEFQRR